MLCKCLSAKCIFVFNLFYIFFFFVQFFMPVNCSSSTYVLWKFSEYSAYFLNIFNSNQCLSLIIYVYSQAEKFISLTNSDLVLFNRQGCCFFLTGNETGLFRKII